MLVFLMLANQVASPGPPAVPPQPRFELGARAGLATPFAEHISAAPYPGLRLGVWVTPWLSIGAEANVVHFDDTDARETFTLKELSLAPAVRTGVAPLAARITLGGGYTDYTPVSFESCSYSSGFHLFAEAAPSYRPVRALEVWAGLRVQVSGAVQSCEEVGVEGRRPAPSGSLAHWGPSLGVMAQL